MSFAERPPVLFAGKSATIKIYIDGTDATTEGTFVSSVTGAALTYTNWHGGEPNNHGGNENCVHTYAEYNGTWNDVTCDTYMPAVCEIEGREC